MPYSESGFIRRTSPKALQDYLAAKAPKVELLIDGSQPPAKVRKALIDCLHKLPRDDRVPITRDWERVAELTDDLDHDAILRAFSDDREEIIRKFEGLKGAHDRALAVPEQAARLQACRGDRICAVLPYEQALLGWLRRPLERHARPQPAAAVPGCGPPLLRRCRWLGRPDRARCVPARPGRRLAGHDVPRGPGADRPRVHRW